jgi:hypothetical protein
MSDVNGAPAGAGEVVPTVGDIRRQIQRLTPAEQGFD